ncbi:MAG: hypothetical protein EHM56_11290, partial [Chloroflexi bacterium]
MSESNSRAKLTIYRALVILMAIASVSACDLFKVGLGEKVDITPPVVKVTSPDQNSYVRGTLTLSGTASDDLSLESLEVTYPGPNGQITKTVKVTNGAWSIDITTGTGAADAILDGEQRIILSARDSDGKETDTMLLAYVDNTPPTVLITVPQGYGVSKSTMSDYIDIKGEVWDRSPIERLNVRVLDSTATQVLEKQADGTNTWSVRFMIDGLANLQTYFYAIDATDRAGNTNTYYYHAADIWTLLGSGAIFPATDEIGKLDQTKTGTAGGIGYAAMYATRLGYVGGAFGDFARNSDSTLPIVHFSNLDPAYPVTGNMLGSKVPINGYINPGPAGNLVIGSSVKAWILPWSATPSWPADPNVIATDITWNSIGDSVSFQIEPRVSDAYVTSGRYVVKIQAGAAGTVSVSSLTCSFLIDIGAPQIDSVRPADLSVLTRKTFASGTPLA